MIKGLMFCFVVWVLVSVGIGVYGHLSGSEKLSVKRSLIYGLVTAIVAGVFVTGAVILF